MRTLVEYVHRSGDIETGFHTGTALTEGTRAHQRMQSAYGEQDRKEVYLSGEIGCRGLVFLLEGRCDGLLAEAEGLTVEEIKSTARRLRDPAEEGRPVHWAQGICYAYLYAREAGLAEMGVRLTYVQTGSDERISSRRRYTSDELEALVADMLDRYYPYAALRLKRDRERDASIAVLPFPYPAYRAGQRRLAGAVYTAIAEGRDLFARAPTGVGKTVSTLYPAVKALGEGKLERIFYLTAKTTTRAAAEETVALMARSGGLRLQTVTLTAKEKVCFRDEMRCSREHCPFAEGYYDRVNAGLLDLLENETLLTRDVLDRYARKHTLCPFELSLDAAYAADAVICDYNYLFDPRVSLKRMLEERKRRTAVLVDEAHNLVERGRDMYSAELLKSPFLELQRAYRTAGPALSAVAKTVNGLFIAIRKSLDGDRSRAESVLPDSLLAAAEDFAQAAEPLLETGPVPGGPEAERHALLLETYYAVQSFLRIAPLFDERYATFIEDSRRELRVKLLCLDPSRQLRQAGKGYRAKVMFSATLSPMSFYIDMLGGAPEDYAIAIPSPFDPGQWDVRVLPLSTRYKDRAATYAPIAALIRREVRERPGNHLVFFPSYDYLSAVLAQLETEGPLPDAELLVQQPGMSEEQRSAFLAAFRPDGGRSLVGLAVLGGVFAEGIDLQGDRLTGVVVVGVGLPQVNPERELMRSHFADSGRDGFDYAYVYPGMNKVQQAGGRLIRSETDRGSIVLVDDRFLQGKYKRLLPEEWREFTVMRGPLPDGRRGQAGSSGDMP